MIEVDRLNVSYPNGERALIDVTMSLAAGRIVGLVGMNGAGKSTLFKSMLGFVKPGSGGITIADNDIQSALRRNLVSYVPQSEDVDWNFPVLVEDVVMMGRYGRMGFLRRPSREDRERVTEALARVDMREYRRRQIGELSGGQKKRMFVARALAQNGRVVLLDEPFTGVDIKTERALITLFRSLAADGHLLLVATHNLGSVPTFCDDVVLLNKTVVAAGTVATTFTAQNLSRVFGGMLRHVNVGGGALHADEDTRQVTVLTDDERPLVLYGDDKESRIIRPTEEDGDG